MRIFALIAGFPVFIFGIIAIGLGVVLTIDPDYINDGSVGWIKLALLLMLGISCLIAAIRSLPAPRWLLLCALTTTVLATAVYLWDLREWVTHGWLLPTLLTAMPALASGLLAHRLWNSRSA